MSNYPDGLSRAAFGAANPPDDGYDDARLACAELAKDVAFLRGKIVDALRADKIVECVTEDGASDLIECFDAAIGILRCGAEHNPKEHD